MLESVQNAVKEGHFEAVPAWLENEDIRTNPKDFQEFRVAADNLNLPDAFLEELAGWFDETLPLDSVIALQQFSGAQVPESVLDSIETGESRPLLDWMEATGARPTLEKLEALRTAQLTPQLIADIRNWMSKLDLTTTGPELSQAALQALTQLAGRAIPGPVLGAVQAGQNRPLISWLEEEGTSPSLADIDALPSFPFSPGLIDDLRAWIASRTTTTAPNRLPAEVIQALTKLTGKPVPKPVLEAVQEGQSQQLTDWLGGQTTLPTSEDVDALANLQLSPDILSNLRAWLEVQTGTTTTRTTVAQPVPEGYKPPAWTNGIAEVASFAGDLKLPPEVEAAVKGGNFAALTNWLRAEDVHTTKQGHKRLKAAADLYSLPPALLKEIDDW